MNEFDPKAKIEPVPQKKSAFLPAITATWEGVDALLRKKKAPPQLRRAAQLMCASSLDNGPKTDTASPEELAAIAGEMAVLIGKRESESSESFASEEKRKLAAMSTEDLVAKASEYATPTEAEDGGRAGQGG